MRKKSGLTIVEQAIVLVPEFEKVVRKLEQQVTLRGQSQSTLNNYIRRIALCVVHFGKLPELVDVAPAPADALSPSKVDDVITALDPLTIDDVAGYSNDPLESEIAFSFRFEYYMFNGDVFNFIPGRAKDENTKKYYLKVSQKKEGTSQVIDNTRKLIHQWIYEIPEWKYKRFIQNQKDLLKTTE